MMARVVDDQPTHLLRAVPDHIDANMRTWSLRPWTLVSITDHNSCIPAARDKHMPSNIPLMLKLARELLLGCAEANGVEVVSLKTGSVGTLK